MLGAFFSQFNLLFPSFYCLEVFLGVRTSLLRLALFYHRKRVAGLSLNFKARKVFFFRFAGLLELVADIP